MAIESFVVPIDACLPPGQQPQHNDNHRCNDPRTLLPPVGQATNAIRDRTDDDGHNPEASEVLKAVGDKRKLHIAVIDKAQNRRQRDHKKQHPSQRPTPNLMPKTPESYRQRDSCGQISPSQRIRDANVPKRIDEG